MFMVFPEFMGLASTAECHTVFEAKPIPLVVNAELPLSTQRDRFKNDLFGLVACSEIQLPPHVIARLSRL